MTAFILLVALSTWFIVELLLFFLKERSLGAQEVMHFMFAAATTAWNKEESGSYDVR